MNNQTDKQDDCNCIKDVNGFHIWRASDCTAQENKQLEDNKDSDKLWGIDGVLKVNGVEFGSESQQRLKDILNSIPKDTDTLLSDTTKGKYKRMVQR